MTLKAVPSKGLVEQVFGQLVTGIMSGTYPAGAHLPSERALAEALHVNRQVVREASRRLAQMRLVEVLHGEGTRVLDFRTHGGLEVLALLMEQPGSRRESMSYWLPILEMRASLAPDVVRHCAKRAKQPLREELVELALRMSRTKDDSTIHALDVRYWDLVHDGADHIVYRLTYNSFKRCVSALAGSQRHAWVATEVRRSGYWLELAKAIAAGDADRAEHEVRTSMRSMLDSWVQQVDAARLQKTSASGSASGSTSHSASSSTSGSAKARAKKTGAVATGSGGSKRAAKGGRTRLRPVVKSG